MFFTLTNKSYLGLFGDPFFLGGSMGSNPGEQKLYRTFRWGENVLDINWAYAMVANAKDFSGRLFWMDSDHHVFVECNNY